MAEWIDNRLGSGFELAPAGGESRRPPDPRGRYEVVTAGGARYALSASAFPLVDIVPASAIGDDPKVPATMTIAWPGKAAETVPIGIEWRGYSAQWYDKKNYDVEVREGDVTFPGLRTDDDWVLNGMPDEPQRLRSFLAQDLWLDMARTPASFNEDAVMGARTRYVELAVGGDYRGVYLVGEQIDRKQLDLARVGADGSGGGELFKAGFWSDATTWEKAPPFDNDAASYEEWEQKYPDPADVGYDYAGLHAALAFATQPAQDTLIANLGDYFDVASLIDYFLFLNVATARDNRGTNTYAARNGPMSPWAIVPWDMDATFGSLWDGTYEPDSGWVLGNQLLYRLLEDPREGFRRAAAARFFDLRGGLLSVDTIRARVAAAQTSLTSHDAAQRERTRWPQYRYTDDGSPIVNAFAARLRQMDESLAPYADSTSSIDRGSAASPVGQLHGHPNPTATSLTLTLPATSRALPRLAYVSSADGRAVRTVDLRRDGLEVDVSDLPPGVYVLQLPGFAPLRFIRADN